MLRMWTLIVLLGLTACGGTEEKTVLVPNKSCITHSDCDEGASCRVNYCVTDGSLDEGESCTEEQQCGAELVCNDFVCTQGCTDPYYVDDCQNQSWCRPVPGSYTQIHEGDLVALGECTPSECNPSETAWCDAQTACVAITADIGACLPYCEYGYVGATYEDTCTDSDANYACQPMGLTQIPVCMPSDRDRAPLPAGDAGCDSVLRPCEEGAVCINVVCRQLCTEATFLDLCGVNSSCTSYGDRRDVYYCSH